MVLFGEKLAKLDRRDLVMDSYFKINQGITNPIKGQKIYGKLKGRALMPNKTNKESAKAKSSD